MGNLITKTTELTMKMVSEYVGIGDSVIDATMGNGNDTLALAQLVGPEGIVYAFDIQEGALERTEQLLSENGLLQRCRLILESHLHMERLIPERERGKIAAVVFNLGYLPQAEKGTTTCVEATLPAVESALGMVRSNGIVAIVMYSGHEEGAKEKTALLEYAERLSARQYHALWFRMLNQHKDPPELLLITKKYNETGRTKSRNDKTPGGESVESRL